MAFMLGSPEGGHDDATVSPAPLALRSGNAGASGAEEAAVTDGSTEASTGSLEGALGDGSLEEPASPLEGAQTSSASDEASGGMENSGHVSRADTLVRRIERLDGTVAPHPAAAAFAAFSAMPGLPAFDLGIDPTSASKQAAPIGPMTVVGSVEEPGTSPEPTEKGEETDPTGIGGHMTAPPDQAGPNSGQQQENSPTQSISEFTPAGPAPALAGGTERTEDLHASGQLLQVPPSQPRGDEEEAPPFPVASSFTLTERLHQAMPPAGDAAEAPNEFSLTPRHGDTRRDIAPGNPIVPPQEIAPQSQRPPAVVPLASALDAAVRLAADASVAAEALENLKRLLEHKQQLESRVPPPMPVSPSPPLPASPPSSYPVAASQSASPLPARVQPPTLRLRPEPDDEEDPEEPIRVAPVAPRRPSRERRGLDVRGFLAGFALSWAVGIALYLFLTAG